MQKENQELLGCTFHPNILQSPNTEGNSFRASSYNRQAMLMLNNSSNSIINSNNVSQGFDLNNMATNLANDLLKQQ